MLFFLGAPLAAGLIQMVLARTSYFYATLQSTLFWLSGLVLTWVCMHMFRHTASRHSFLACLSVLAFLTAVYVLWQPCMRGRHFFGLTSWPTEDMAGPFQNRNTYASFIELALPVLLWQGLRFRSRAWMLWLGAPLMLATVVQVASRAGSILVLAEVPITIFLLARVGLARRRAITATASILAGAVLLAFAAGWDHLWLRLQFDDPLKYRSAIYASTIEMIAQRPLSGVGLGTFQQAYPAYGRFDVGKVVNFAHNDWLQWAAEGGLPVAAALLVFAIYVCRKAIEHPWGIGIAFVFLHGLIDYPMQRMGLACWVFAMAGAILSTGQPHQPESRLGDCLPIQQPAPVNQ
jgi:O-antigen ligase